MKLPTASKLALADECPPSFVLPQMRETHETAVEGNDKHDDLRDAVENNVDALSQSNPWRDAALEVLNGRLTGAKCEAAYAYDVATGTARLLGYDLGRHYGQTDTEFAGAADYVVDLPDVIEVWDLKTGLTPQEPLEHHAQMKGLACAVGTTHGKPVRTMLLIAPRDGQKPRIVAGPTYGAFDVLELGEWLRGIAERLAAADTTPEMQRKYSAGKWCGTCPARLSCPVRTARFAALVKDPEGVMGDVATMLATPELRSRGLDRYEEIKADFKWLTSQVYANVAEHGPIPRRNGKVFGPHETTSEVFDPEAVWPWLSERFGVDAAKDAMTLKTSKTAIARVVGEKSPRGKKTAAVEAALAELRAIPGAVTVKRETTTEEHTPRTLSAATALADTVTTPPELPSSALSQPGAQESNQ